MSYHDTPAGLPAVNPRESNESSEVAASGLPSSAALPVNSIPPREHQIQSAVAFLQSPKTLDRPDNEKVAFLEGNVGSSPPSPSPSFKLLIRCCSYPQVYCSFD